MLALIDIGNTTITIGLSHDLNKIDNVLKINTIKTISADEYALVLKEMLKGVTEVIISSVVPELNSVFKEFLQERMNIIPMFMGQGVKTGIKIMSDNPKEVGTDIIANLVAATQQYGHTCLVIDLGTATTFSYIEDLAFKGAIIAPGLTTSKNALISRTSLLPQVELEMPTKLIGTNSTDSIKSGLIFGHASMIDGIIRRIKKQVISDNLPVIITGGHAKLIFPHCFEKITLDENLILKGLLLVYRRNITKSR
ncbi:MAG: type III pantothenate kinase [Candidatus Izemoplasmatales bacterium]|jgi:type III pantothenate kinase|nr:type III pantothenate kinase [Candidatus Izemoplasmatales bacterium]MDD3865878.1 type III pantothenate kinase [Candidatus Izemoplasmatales bacterium]